MISEGIRIQKEKTSTFIDNMSLPIHRWFRYSAGFSAKWVEEVICQELIKKGVGVNDKKDFVVLDPFAGSGTTLLASEAANVKSVGFESHPLVFRVAEAKLFWNTNIDLFSLYAKSVLDLAKTLEGSKEEYPTIVYKCYDDYNLITLDKLKKALYTMKDDSAQYKLTWLAFVSIIRCSSHAGTAQWQYVLPNKTKAKVSDAFEAFERQIELMCLDMNERQKNNAFASSTLLRQDSRGDFEQFNDEVDLIITSPPYANNYDYADATRLELSVLGEISGWGDLQNTVRDYLVRSCSQQVSKEKKYTYEFIDDPLLKCIKDDLYEVCSKLDKEKDLHGGKKNYHTMIALYFLDLAKIWHNLRKVCKVDSTVCFVIGDSAPYGIYVPVDKWLGELALSADFKDYYFEKTRDRNVKWKNRKHTVPLKEGRLWIRG